MSPSRGAPRVTPQEKLWQNHVLQAAVACGFLPLCRDAQNQGNHLCKWSKNRANSEVKYQGGACRSQLRCEGCEAVSRASAGRPVSSSPPWFCQVVRAGDKWLTSVGRRRDHPGGSHRPSAAGTGHAVAVHTGPAWCSWALIFNISDERHQEETASLSDPTLLERVHRVHSELISQDLAVCQDSDKWENESGWV